MATIRTDSPVEVYDKSDNTIATVLIVLLILAAAVAFGYWWNKTYNVPNTPSVNTTNNYTYPTTDTNTPNQTAPTNNTSPNNGNGGSVQGSANVNTY